jgi:hypothetical protein
MCNNKSCKSTNELTRAEFYDVVCDCVRTQAPITGVCARCNEILGSDEISMCHNCEEGIW